MIIDVLYVHDVCVYYCKYITSFGKELVKCSICFFGSGFFNGSLFVILLLFFNAQQVNAFIFLVEDSIFFSVI